jgi:predicted negative regulator of RcsB-dependent stress response
MSEVTTALQAKKAELEAELKAVLELRDAEIQAARDKYAASLKQIKAKQGALKRMMKTAEERL